jgi:NADH-quinone oxidoreductase E subunit
MNAKLSFNEWSANAEKQLSALKQRYPDQRSAVMPALYMVQEYFGSITEEAVSWVSKQLDIPPVHVMEVATFYTMYYKKPVGRYHFQVCRTLSCALCGSKKITEHLKKRFAVAPNQVSKDGMWSYEEVECLGSCGTAPVCEINDRFFENLTAEKLDKIIDLIGEEKPDLRYSAVADKLGDGLKTFPKSEVI